MIQLIDLLNEAILEAKFQDIEVVPTKGVQRGTSESGAKSYAIIIGNPSVYHKMEQTPMGKSGKMSAFKYEGHEGPDHTEFTWNADTTQWEVWQRMNYLILTSRHETHWYHGKMPGGAYKGWEGSTSTPLPDLKIDKFGYKVYKALLSEPNVGWIVSDESSTPEVKNGVYKKLMQDPDFVWIAANGDNINTYTNIVVINPSHANVERVKQIFETNNKGAKFYYSKNFPI